MATKQPAVSKSFYHYSWHLPLQLSIPLQMKREMVFSKQKKVFAVLSVVIKQKFA